MTGVAFLLVMAAGAAETPGACPAGTVFDRYTSIRPVPEGTLYEWNCKPALNQLENIATGQVDTCVGFDGGNCPTGATVNAAIRDAIPDITPAEIERASSDPAVRAAAGELTRATQAVQQAQSRLTELRTRQQAATTQAEKQRIQIDIMRAEQQRQAARGAERLATMRVKKVIRQAPVVE